MLIPAMIAVIAQNILISTVTVSLVALRSESKIVFSNGQASSFWQNLSVSASGMLRAWKPSVFIPLICLGSSCVPCMYTTLMLSAVAACDRGNTTFAVLPLRSPFLMTLV